MVSLSSCKFVRNDHILQALVMQHQDKAWKTSMVVASLSLSSANHSTAVFGTYDVGHLYFAEYTSTHK